MLTWAHDRWEGWYERAAAGHFGTFDGTVDVLRLEVWSTPHRASTRCFATVRAASAPRTPVDGYTRLRRSTYFVGTQG
jgi:hypothetical protein